MGAEEGLYPGGAFDGTDFSRLIQRALDGTIDDGLVAQIVAAALLKHDGTNFLPLRTQRPQRTTAINSTGVGATLDISDSPAALFAIQVEQTTGANPFSVDLELRIHASGAFFAIQAASVDHQVYFLADRPAVGIRYNVTTVNVLDALTVNLLALP